MASTTRAAAVMWYTLLASGARRAPRLLAARSNISARQTSVGALVRYCCVVPGTYGCVAVWVCVLCFAVGWAMRWVQKTNLNFFDWVFRLADPFLEVANFDWIPLSKTKSKTVQSKRPFCDKPRKRELGFSRKWPFSTAKSDCARNGFTNSGEEKKGLYYR